MILFIVSNFHFYFFWWLNLSLLIMFDWEIATVWLYLLNIREGDALLLLGLLLLLILLAEWLLWLVDLGFFYGEVRLLMISLCITIIVVVIIMIEHPTIICPQLPIERMLTTSNHHVAIIIGKTIPNSICMFFLVIFNITVSILLLLMIIKLVLIILLLVLIVIECIVVIHCCSGGVVVEWVLVLWYCVAVWSHWLSAHCLVIVVVFCYDLSTVLMALCLLDTRYVTFYHVSHLLLSSLLLFSVSHLLLTLLIVFIILILLLLLILTWYQHWLWMLLLLW